MRGEEGGRGRNALSWAHGQGREMGMVGLLAATSPPQWRLGALTKGFFIVLAKTSRDTQKGIMEAAPETHLQRQNEVKKGRHFTPSPNLPRTKTIDFLSTFSPSVNLSQTKTIDFFPK